MTDDIKVGDRIVVPFGLTEIEGMVLRLSSPGLRPMVTVSLRIEGADEPMITSYPREDVRLAA